MKKSVRFWIIFSVLTILIITLLFNFIYLTSFHKNLRPISEIDRAKAIEILNKTVNVDGYQIKAANVYSVKNRNLVQIQLIKNNSRKYYLIDLTEDKIWGK